MLTNVSISQKCLSQDSLVALEVVRTCAGMLLSLQTRLADADQGQNSINKQLPE